MEEDPFAMLAPRKTQDDKSKDKAAAEPENAKTDVAPETPKSRTTKIAQGGKEVAAPPPPRPFPSWPQNHTAENEFVPDDTIDFTDLSELNLEINRARRRSFLIKNALADARREEARTAEEYRRAYNRALVGMSGGNAEHRKAMAEIQTEDLYSTKIIAEGVVKELVNLSYTVSRDLDTLKTISDNLRKQMSM